MLEIWGQGHLAPLATPMPSRDLLGPCRQPGACGPHTGNPCFLECFFQHNIWYGPKSEKVDRCT